MNHLLYVTTIGQKENAFPIIQNIWDFFSHKGTKTIFISIGTGQSPLVELDFSEMLGCPIHLFDGNKKNLTRWEQIKDVLKTRKMDDTTDDFVKSAAKKWVLPRNVNIYSKLPFFHDGTIVLNNEQYEIKEAYQIIKDVCETMGFPEDEVHIDVLKIEINDQESPFLNSILHAGFRPSFIMIHWTALPDSDIRSMNTAGNLQMQGYALVGKEGNNFLYYFNGNNYYETCSWEKINKTNENTLVNEIVESVLPKDPSKNEKSS